MEGDEKKTESREDAELREYVLAEFEKPVTPEQAKRLDQELADTAEFFGAGGIDFYVAGGSGLDLLDGEWKRDHQDLDVGIQDKDRLKFLEQAEREGFIITDHRRTPLTKEDILDPKRHNCFTLRERNGVQEGFETMFLPQGEDAAYENAPKFQKAGHEIRLQPPEIILFHKLLDGRRKDFRDIRKVWATLDEARKRDVQRRIDEAGVRFKIDEKEETSVEELLAAAPELQKGRDAAFFEDGAYQRRRNESEARIRGLAAEVYTLRQEIPTREAFMARMAEKYGEATAERQSTIEQMGDFLYNDPAPDEESFATWALMAVGGKSEEQLRRDAARDFKEEKIWEQV